MTRLLILLLIFGSCAESAYADPCPPERVLRNGSDAGSSPSISTSQSLPYPFWFEGLTSPTGVSVNCVERSGTGGAADPTPNNMIVPTPVIVESASGTEVVVTIEPARMATPADMRKGRKYQCTVEATGTVNGVEASPQLDACVTVKNLYWTP